MIMSNLINEDSQIQKKNSNQFIQKLKFLVHQQLKKSTIIFTATNQNTTFHYYTFLDSQINKFIELYWIVQFQSHQLSISITYTAYRTIGIPIIVNDLRTKIQINSVLRILNKSMPYFLTFILNQKNQVSLNFHRSIFHQTDRIAISKGIKSIINQALLQATQGFCLLAPYLSVSVQNNFKNIHGQKKLYETEQFNLIKLKNTFDRFRKNRQKTSDLIYQQKDINKIRKKIQISMNLLGIQLKSLTNLQFSTKQIRREMLLQTIETKEPQMSPTKVDKIAYQFQILNIQQNEQKYQTNANSQIYLGKYNFRIFKTLIQDQKTSKSQNYTRKMPMFEQKDVIQERVAKLVKKRSNSKLSQKALRNQISFLKFIRNQICLYIANYYLPLDNGWSQLYIEHYQQSLLNLIQSNQPKSFQFRLQIMINLAKGLKFIADMNICHRDIKPSNVMINHFSQPKIIDFGSSISVNNQKVLMVCNQTLCATDGYHYPYEDCEQKIKFLFDRKQYETHPLFDAYSYGVIIQNVFSQQLKQSYNNFSVKDTLTFILQKCKQKNPDNRLSYDEILCLLIVLRKSLLCKQKGKQIL